MVEGPTLTALHVAAASGSAKAVEALVRRAGADPNDEDASGRTPMTMCIQHAPSAAHAARTAWALLQHGAKIDEDTLRVAAARPGQQGIALLALCTRYSRCRLPREGLERATRDLLDEGLPMDDRAMAFDALVHEGRMAHTHCKALTDCEHPWAAAERAKLKALAAAAAWDFQSLAGGAKAAVDEYTALLAVARSHAVQPGEEARRGALLRAWRAREEAANAWEVAAVAIGAWVAAVGAAEALPPSVQAAVAKEEALCTHISAQVGAALEVAHRVMTGDDPIERYFVEEDD